MKEVVYFVTAIAVASQLLFYKTTSEFLMLIYPCPPLIPGANQYLALSAPKNSRLQKRCRIAAPLRLP